MTDVAHPQLDRRRVLVATKNTDKFRLLAEVFAIAGFPRLIPIDRDYRPRREVGDIMARARQKAVSVPKQTWMKSYDGVLGVDDGLSLNGGPVSAHSKSLTDRILRGDACEVGDAVAIVRAHAIVLRERPTRPLVAVAEIPFTFVGNPLGVRRPSKGGLPLLHVLGASGSHESLHSAGPQQLVEYFFQHSVASVRSLWSTNPDATDADSDDHDGTGLRRSW